MLQFELQESIINITAMKSLKLFHCLILFSIMSCVLAQQHEYLALDKPYQQTLNQTSMFTGRYVFSISQSDVKKMKGEKWFFFVEVEPDEINEWVNTNIVISIGKKGEEQSRNERVCGSRRGGVDSCFFTNKQFDYKTEDIHSNVHCMGPCKFKISAQISQPYKLTPGEKIEMDFQNTAYSKVFQLDTTDSQTFDQLRIILRPQGFLQFPAPISLYVNKGVTLPTRRSHDMSSITLWDNGQGIFIDSPDAQGIFTILVESPEKNVLNLFTELISFKDSYEVTEALPYFDYIGQGASKYYKCKVNPSKGLNVKFSTFSGAVKMVGIYDEEMSAINEQFPELYRSFSEMEYQISVKFFKDNQKYYTIKDYLIFKVEGVKESTFLFEYYQLNRAISHLVPQLNRYVELPPREFNQYYIQIVELNTPEFKKEQIQIVVTHEEHKLLKVRFFKCDRQHGIQCELKRSDLSSTNFDSKDINEIIYTTKESIGAGVEIYKFSLQAKLFKKMSDDVKKYTMGIVIENPSSQQQLYTIRYTNVGHNVYLKEKEVQKDRLSIDEVKYYLFTNRHEDVKEIRVHLMEISGRVNIQGSYQDPRSSNVEGNQIYDFHNTVRFNHLKQNQTIYLKVTGKEAAYYSLQVQTVKESEREWWNRTRGKGYNQIVIFEDIPYEFSIEPHEKVVYQVHTKHKQFLLEMSALLPLELCMTEELSKPPFPPNCEQSQRLTKREAIDVRMDKGMIGNIGVVNNNDKANKFNIKFYVVGNVPSSDTKDDYTTTKCLPLLASKVAKYNIKSSTSTCYSYSITNFEDTEITMDLVNDQYDQINVLAVVGEVEKVEIVGEVHVFSKGELEKACNKTLPCQLKLFFQSKIDSEIRFTVQPLTGTVFLLDGIANEFSGSIFPTRYFAYQLYNLLNTTIIVESKNGMYRFYGSVVEANKYWSKQVKHPNSINNTIKSANPFYYYYQMAILTEKMIKEAGCTECLLLITVEKEAEARADQKSKFSIQCTQEDRFLKENTAVASYLSKHSFAFYQLESESDGVILISLSSQNQDCAKIYVKKGQTRASGSDYDFMSQSNSLLIEKAQKAHYDITVQATDNCYYSIDYTTATTKIYSTIYKGLYADVRLEKSQEQRLIYHHTTNQSFRILTLHQTGEVIINVREYKTIKEFINDNSMRKKYNWSGRDFLRVEADSKSFCFNCYYLIALSAERQTKTSVMIPSDASQFPIMMDSIIKQQLKKDQFERLRVYTDRIVQFEINVQYGAVNVSLMQGEKDKAFVFTKIYRANQATQYEAINNTADPKADGFYLMSYTKLILKAEEDSGFSFGLISDKNASKRGSRIKYGIPEYISLEKAKKQCVVGTLDNNDQQFLISITGDKQVDLMNNLEISCQLPGSNFLELTKDIAKNEMIVKIDKPPKKLPSQYEFCFRSKEDVFLTFIQSSRLLYLPEATTVMVSSTMNFTFYSEGRNVLEINECKSRAITTVFHDFSTADRMNSEIKQVRKANNIMEFQYYGLVYVQIEAVSATIAWRKKDQTLKTGFGYDQYFPSKLRYEVVGTVLRVQVFQLKKVDQADVQFGEISYAAYLAVEEMNLYEAINCASGLFLSKSKVVKYDPNKSNLQFADVNKVTLQFDISDILLKFGSKKYILVGALVNSTSQLANDGKYRFIYPYQQVPIALLKGVPEWQDDYDPKLPEKPEEEGSVLKYLAIGVLVCFLGLIIYRVFLKQIIRKRRIQRLSEQGAGEVQYEEFASRTSA